MSERLHLLVGPRAAVAALAALLRARGVAVAPCPLDLVDRRLGPRRACPAPGTPPDVDHVCPRHDPVGYFGRAVAEARSLEADQAPGTVIPHGVPGVVGRFTHRLEAHLRPLIDPEHAAPPRPYATSFLLSARRRTPGAVRRTNLLRAALERTGTPVVALAPADDARRAAYAAHLLVRPGRARAHLPGLTADPIAPVHALRRAPAAALMADVRAALAAQQVGADVPLLLRTTEGFNLHLVRLTGTDRGDRRRTALDWTEYRGAPRAFHEVVFASTEDEIVGRAPAPGGTCLDKLDETPDPLLLAYDARALEEVRRKEFAFRPGVAPANALLAVFEVRP